MVFYDLQVSFSGNKNRIVPGHVQFVHGVHADLCHLFLVDSKALKKFIHLFRAFRNQIAVLSVFHAFRCAASLVKKQIIILLFIVFSLSIT